MENQEVLECAAYGVKTDVGEDEIMISVAMKPGKSIKPEDIIKFCDGKMADFMIPKYIRIVDKLPKSEVHRVLKRELKAIGITKDTYVRGEV